MLMTLCPSQQVFLGRIQGESYVYVTQGTGDGSVHKVGKSSADASGLSHGSFQAC